MKTLVERGLPRAARACLVAATFLAPVVFLRGAGDGFQLTKLVVLWTLGAVALGCWVMSAAERRAWLPSTRAIPVAIALVAIVALATALSISPPTSVIGLYSRYGGLVPLALYVALAVLVVALWWERPDGVAALVWAAAAATVPAAAYVLLQAHRLDPFDWGLDAAEAARLVKRHAQYPPGTIGNSNFTGGYLGIALPAIAYAFVAARRPLARAAIAACGLLAVVGLWFTHSRGGMLAGAAGMGVMIVLALRSRRLRVLLVTGAVAAVAVAGVFVTRHTSQSPQPGSVGSVVLRADTLASRTDYWRAAARIWLDHPVLGTGPDTFLSQYPPLRPASDGANFGLVLPDKPHNVFLEWAVSAGLLGIGTYLLLLGTVLAQGIRRVSRLEGRPRALVIALVAMLCAYMVQAFFSIDQPPLVSTSWLVIGAIVAMADPSLVRARRRHEAAAERGPEEAETRQARRAARYRSRWAVHVVVLLVVVALVSLGARALLADVQARRSELAARRHPTRSDAMRIARRAAHLDPREATYAAVLGDAAERRAAAVTDVTEKRRWYAAARRQYERALEMRPGHIYYLLALARVDSRWAAEADPDRFPIADESWTAAVEFDPTDWEVHDLYATALNTWANAAGGDPTLRRRTAEELTEVLRIRPIYVDGWVNLARIQQVRGETASARVAAQQALALDPTHRDAAELRALVNEPAN